MQPTVAEQVATLLRHRPAPGDPPEVRAAWLVRKADVLDAVAVDAAGRPGLVDPVLARRVADEARARVAGVRL